MATSSTDPVDDEDKDCCSSGSDISDNDEHITSDEELPAADGGVE